MPGRTYTPPVLRKGCFTMDNTVEGMKKYSQVMRIMFKAVEAQWPKASAAKGITKTRNSEC